MKISQATEEQKIRAIAEIAGGEHIEKRVFLFPFTPQLEKQLRNKFGDPKRPGLFGPFEYWYHTQDDDGKDCIITTYTAYSSSYDAILPVIQKQSISIKMGMVALFWKPDNANNQSERMALMLWMQTPSQLCDALLVAKGVFEI